MEIEDIGLRNVPRATRETLKDTGFSVHISRNKRIVAITFFLGGGGKSKSSNMWLVDSGATQHMTSSIELIRKYKDFGPVEVHLADDGVVQAIGKGDIVMLTRTRQGVKKGVLTDAWHIPKLSQNLFSVGRFIKDVRSVTFNSMVASRPRRVSSGNLVHLKEGIVKALHDTGAS